MKSLVQRHRNSRIQPSTWQVESRNDSPSTKHNIQLVRNMIPLDRILFITNHGKKCLLIPVTTEMNKHSSRVAEAEVLPEGVHPLSDYTLASHESNDPVDLAINMDNDLRLPPESSLGVVSIILPKSGSISQTTPRGCKERLYKRLFLKRPKLAIHPKGPRFHLRGKKLEAANLVIHNFLKKRAIITLEEIDFYATTHQFFKSRRKICRR